MQGVVSSPPARRDPTYLTVTLSVYAFVCMSPYFVLGHNFAVSDSIAMKCGMVVPRISTHSSVYCKSLLFSVHYI